jgi:hypothetical protein
MGCNARKTNKQGGGSTGWRKVRNEDLHNWYTSSDICGGSTCRKMKWVGRYVGISDHLHMLCRFSRRAHWLEMWVDQRTDPETVDKSKIPCRCEEWNPDSSVSRPVPYSNRMREQRFSHARCVLLQTGQFIASAHDISKAEPYQIWKQVSYPSLQSTCFTVCLYFNFSLSGHTNFVVVIYHICNVLVFW